MQRKLFQLGSFLIASSMFFGAGTSFAGPKSHRNYEHPDHHSKGYRGHGWGDAPAVPELGAAGAGSAIALMLGVGLILADRRRRASSAPTR